jgi:hypothetical protein
MCRIVRIKLAQKFAHSGSACRMGANYFAAINCSKRGLPRSGSKVGSILSQPGDSKAA